MTPPKTTIGPFEIYAIETGRFKLDGGAMFGVIPRPLWERYIKPDEKNRILMAMRCLLIKSRATERVYLVDNGIGTKYDEKMAGIYQLDFGHSDLSRSLEKCDVRPEDVTDMIFSHLHFDHCGGTTFYDGKGLLQLRFPNATHWVNRRHLESVRFPNIREKASFLPENIEPLVGFDRLQTTEDYHIFEEGLSTLPVNGHSCGQQLPLLEADGKTLLFAGDLFPTSAHIPPLWVMAYDIEPMQTLIEKEEVLKKAVDGSWHLFLEHDANHEVITVQNSNGGYAAGPSMTLADI